MTQEEIMIRLGVDGTALDRGLRSTKEKLNEWARESANGVTGMFKSMLGAISVERLLEKGIEIFKQNIEQAKRIKAEAAALSVSTDFIQDLQNVARQAGTSADAVEHLLDKFAKKLPVGADVEESFYKIAKQLDNIPDPATRARLAIDNFGKSGIEMIRIIKAAHGDIEGFAQQFAKLSSPELNLMEVWDRQMDKSIGWMKRLASLGLTINMTAVQSLWKMFTRDPQQAGKEMANMLMGEIGMSKEEIKAFEAAQRAKDEDEHLVAYKKHLSDIIIQTGTRAEKEAELNKQLEYENHLAEQAGGKGDLISVYDAMAKVATIQGEISKLKAEDRKDQDEADKKHNQQVIDELNAQDKIAYLKQRGAEETMRQYQPSLDQVSHAGRWVRGSNTAWNWVWQPSQAARIAQGAEAFGNAATNAFAMGNVELGKSFAARAEELKNVLRQAGIISPDMRMEAIEHNTRRLQDIADGKATVMVEPGGD